MKLRLIFTAAFVCLLGLAGLTGLTYAASGGYSLDWWTVDGGGGSSSTGGSYSLGGSIGQPDAGTSSGGTYLLEGGFWGGSLNITPNYRIYLPLVKR
jgi:hypothetical protein